MVTCARPGLVYTPVLALFVLLWSSGFIAAKIGVVHADTLTFFSLRYAVVTALMSALGLAMGAPWPRCWREVAHVAVAGSMLQVTYFGGVWLAVGKGVGAGVVTLIVCTQPIITAALVGPFLGERVTRRQWLGLALGTVGVALMVVHKLALGFGTITGMIWALIGLLGITFGTLYQKKYCADMDLRSGSAVQFLVATVSITPAALVFEDNVIDWTPAFFASLAYVALFLLLISMMLLTVMICRGAVSQMTSLFFLVPSVTTLLAYLILGEPVGLITLIGMVIALVGVVLVVTPVCKSDRGGAR